MKDAVKSGLKVFVDGCDVSHDTLPVGPLCVRHLINVLEKRHSLGVTYFIWMFYFIIYFCSLTRLCH